MESHRGITKDCFADSLQNRHGSAATHYTTNTSTNTSKYNSNNKRLLNKKRQVHKSPSKMKPNNRYKRHFKAKAYQSPVYHKYHQNYDSDSSDSIQDSYLNLNLNFQKNHWKQQSNNTALTSVAGYSMDSHGGISSNSLYVSQIDMNGKRNLVKRMEYNRFEETSAVIPYTAATTSRTSTTASYYPPRDEFLYNLHSIRDRSESLISQNTDIWTLEPNTQSNVLERLMQVLSKGLFCTQCSSNKKNEKEATPTDLQESFTITERTMTMNSEEEDSNPQPYTAKKKKRGLQDIATVKRNNNSKNSLVEEEKDYGVSYVNVGELDGKYHDTRDDACSVYSIEYQHCKDLNYTSTLDDSHHALNHVNSMHSLGDVDAMNNHGDLFLSPKGNTQKQLFQEEENDDTPYENGNKDESEDDDDDEVATNHYNLDKKLDQPPKKKKHQRYDSELPLSPMSPTQPLPRGRTGTSSPIPPRSIIGRPPMISSRMTSYGMQSQSGYMSARERLHTGDNQTVCTMNTFHTVNTTGTYHRRTDSSCTFTANSLAMIFHGEHNHHASREREVATTTPIKSPTANIIPKTVKTVSKRRNGTEVQDEISPLDIEEGTSKSRNYRELLEKYGGEVSEESDYDSSTEKHWNREVKVDLFQNADTPSSIVDSVDGEHDDPHSITASDAESSSHCLSPIDLNKSIPRTKPSSAGIEVALPPSSKQDGVYFPQSKVFREELQETDEIPITFEGWVAYSREEGELQHFVQKKNRIKRNHLRYVILKDNKLYIRSSRKANGDRDSQSLLSNDKVLKLSTKMHVENEYISKRHGQCITIREPRLISEKGKASDLVCTILPVQLDTSFFKDEECSQLISTDDYKKVRDYIFGKKNGGKKDTFATTTKAYHDKTPYPTRDNSLSSVWPMNIFDTTVPFEQNTTALHIFFALDIAIRYT